MHPILFKIGNFSIYTYGLFVSLGIFTAASLILRNGRRKGIRSNSLLDLFIVVILSGILGGRIVHILVYLPYYLRHPVKILLFRQGGLAIQGALIFGLAGAVIYLFRKRETLPPLKTLDIISLYMPVGHAIGRIGCFLNGCCYGNASSLPWAVKFPLLQGPVHPTQIYYLLSNLIIFLILSLFYRHKKDGEVICLYFFLYSVSRYNIDFLRGDLSPSFIPLYSTQVFALILALISAAFLLYFHFRRAK